MVTVTEEVRMLALVRRLSDLLASRRMASRYTSALD
jgi:hypothetical protein